MGTAGGSEAAEHPTDPREVQRCPGPCRTKEPDSATHLCATGKYSQRAAHLKYQLGGLAAEMASAYTIQRLSALVD